MAKKKNTQREDGRYAVQVYIAKHIKTFKKKIRIIVKRIYFKLSFEAP